MDSNILILDKLTEIAEKLTEQNLFQKTVLNFNEACAYLDLSQVTPLQAHQCKAHSTLLSTGQNLFPQGWIRFLVTPQPATHKRELQKPQQTVSHG